MDVDQYMLSLLADKDGWGKFLKCHHRSQQFSIKLYWLIVIVKRKKKQINAPVSNQKEIADNRGSGRQQTTDRHETPVFEKFACYFV